MFSKKNMTLVCVVSACLLVCFFAQVAAAQASGVPASFFGTVTNVTALPGMPPGSCSAVQSGGRYNRNFDSEISNCFTATASSRNRKARRLIALRSKHSLA